MTTELIKRGTSHTKSQTEGGRRMVGPKVHNRIRLLRHERGLSQKALAEVFGLNHRTIGYLEREDYMPSLSLAWAIADYFGLPMEAVFSREPFPQMSHQLYGAPETSPRKEVIDYETAFRDG